MSISCQKLYKTVGVEHVTQVVASEEMLLSLYDAASIQVAGFIYLSKDTPNFSLIWQVARGRMF